MTPPDLLNQSIIQVRTQPHVDTVQLPIAFLSPVIDGQVTTFFEWRGAGDHQSQSTVRRHVESRRDFHGDPVRIRP